MGRKINRQIVDLEMMETEDIYALRHAYEREITDAIHGVNLCNIELNGRGDQLLLPEFGNPIVSVEGMIESNVAPIPRRPGDDAA